MSEREVELGNVCKSLQQQVSQLQDVLTSVSNYVFQGGVISASNDETGVLLLQLFSITSVFHQFQPCFKHGCNALFAGASDGIKLSADFDAASQDQGG